MAVDARHVVVLGRLPRLVVRLHDVAARAEVGAGGELEHPHREDEEQDPEKPEELEEPGLDVQPVALPSGTCIPILSRRPSLRCFPGFPFPAPVRPFDAFPCRVTPPRTSRSLRRSSAARSPRAPRSRPRRSTLAVRVDVDHGRGRPDRLVDGPDRPRDGEGSSITVFWDSNSLNVSPGSRNFPTSHSAAERISPVAPARSRKRRCGRWVPSRGPRRDLRRISVRSRP